MNDRLKYLAETFVPFLIAGIGIALAISLLIMFSYVLVWGIIIGGVMWAALLIKNLLFSKKTKNIAKPKTRIIEHDDKD